MTGLLICILFVAGLGVTTIGAVLLARTRAFVRRAATAQGRYVGAAWGDSASDLDVTPQRTAYPLVEFQTADGQTIRFEARTGTPWAGRKSGRPVEVIYDPQNPQHAVVHSSFEMWLPALIFLTVGLSLIAAALAVVTALAATLLSGSMGAIPDLTKSATWL